MENKDIGWIQLKFDFPAFLPPPKVFASVKRLEWWHRDDASRSGGINSLCDVLQLIPQLEYLAVGGTFQPYSFSTQGRHLGCLKTLRLVRVNEFFMWQISRWSLPSLRHLIIDWSSSIAAINGIHYCFSLSLQTVELGRSLCFYPQDHLTSLLALFPNLTELSYYIHFTHPPILQGRPHSALTIVRLHAQPNQAIRDEAQLWSFVAAHFSYVSSPLLPALQRVVLHGDWASLLNDSRFLPCLRELRCTVEYPDGSVAVYPPTTATW